MRGSVPPDKVSALPHSGLTDAALAFARPAQLKPGTLGGRGVGTFKWPAGFSVPTRPVFPERWLPSWQHVVFGNWDLQQ